MEPCTTYLITINAYLGITQDNQTIFEGNQEEIEEKTMPDMTNPFELNTLRVDIKEKSLVVVWEKTELNQQCLSFEDLQFSVCDYYLQRGSCFQNKTGLLPSDSLEKYFRVQFNNLQPCRSQQVCT